MYNKNLINFFGKNRTILINNNKKNYLMNCYIFKNIKISIIGTLVL